jgi:hypothetical protein
LCYQAPTTPPRGRVTNLPSDGDPGRTELTKAFQSVPLANREKSLIEPKRKSSGLANKTAKENAASGATEHCAIDKSEVTQLLANGSHVSVSKSIRYALALGTSAAWQGVILVLFARLNTTERASLAFAALSSLDDDTAYQTASLVLFGTLDGEAVQ